MRVMDEVWENRLLSRWAQLLPAAPRRLGEVHHADAELVDLGGGRVLALTVDQVLEEVRTGLYRKPETAGRIAAVAALSDLAAVGAEPLGLLVSATLPRDGAEAAQEGIARGLAEVCAAAGTFVLGGDTNEGPELSVGVTGAGVLPRQSLRTRLGAAPGHGVWASGPVGLGGALAGAALLGLPGLDEADFRPRVRVAEGLALRGVASACMDTSDGLVATLDQLARINGVGIRITRPLAELLHPAAEALRGAAGLPAFPFLASHHGEFELVFTVAPDREGLLQERAAALGWEPLRVGVVEEAPGLRLGEVAVDGAEVRNGLARCGGDARAYLVLLVRLSPS